MAGPGTGGEKGRKTVLVAASSGNIGRATISALGKYADTVDVRAGVRDPAKAAHLAALAPNVSVVAADPLNSTQIGESLKEVNALFVILPPAPNRAQICNAAIDAAKAAGVEFILVLSIPSVDVADTIFGKQVAPIEAHVKEAGVPYALLRLPLFLENAYGSLKSIKEDGAWHASVDPEKHWVGVAAKDAGEVAAKILSDPQPHIHKTYFIASPPDTYAHLAKYFTDALGKPVEYKQVPPESMKQALVSSGMPDWQAGGVVELENLINKGYPPMSDPQGAKNVEGILGRPATSFEDWVKANAEAFK